MAVKLISCTCVNEYQEKRYKGLRLANSCGREGKRFRCTVCGKEKENSSETKPTITDTKKK